MSSHSKDVADAALHFLGSLFQIDIYTNAAVLISTLAGKNDKARLKRVQGRLTMLLNPNSRSGGKYKSLSDADRESVADATTQALKAIAIDDELVKSTNNPVKLQELIWQRSSITSHPAAAKGSSTLPFVEQMMKIVCDWIAEEVKRSPELFGPRLEQAITDVRRLEHTQIKQQESIASHAEQIAGFGAALQAARNLGAESGARTERFIAIADFRPTPSSFIGREKELVSLSGSVTQTGAAVIAGRQMVGRFEIARQWCGAQRDPAHAWAIEYRSAAQLASAAEGLAEHYGVPWTGDITGAISNLLRGRPNLTIIILGLDRPDLLGRLLASSQPQFGVLLLVVDGTQRTFTGQIDVGDLSEDETLALIRAEVGPLAGHSVGLERLAHCLSGEPLLVRQAAALLRRSPDAMDELVEALSERPADVALTPLTSSERDHTAARIWLRALDACGTETGMPGDQAMALLHIMQDWVPDGAWAISLHMLLHETDEFEAIPKARFHLLRSTLAQLGLITVGEGFVLARSAVLQFCWEQLDEGLRRRAVIACLEAAQGFAIRGKFSRQVGLYNQTAWMQGRDTYKFRRYMPDLYDAVVRHVAVLMQLLDLGESALDFLQRHFGLLIEDPNSNPWPTALHIGRLLIDVDRPHSLEYAEGLIAEHQDAKTIGEYEAAFWEYVALVRWDASDLEGCILASEEGFAVLDLCPTVDRQLMEANLRRLRGQAQVSLGEVEAGLSDFRKVISICNDDPGLVSMTGVQRATIRQFLQVREIENWREFDTNDATNTLSVPAHADIVRNNAEWMMAESSRRAGHYDEAEELLGPEPDISFGPYYFAISRADHAVRLVGIAMEKAESEGRTPPASLLKILDEALALIDELPPREREFPRLLGHESALLIQKSNVLLILGRSEEAVRLARRALESDARVFGIGHSEYADDASVLAQALILSGARSGKSRVAEARRWVRVARDIYRSPGPHQDLLKAKSMEQVLRMIR
jgi:tetratricopeptide (TPR) repeat protein